MRGVIATESYHVSVAYILLCYVQSVATTYVNNVDGVNFFELKEKLWHALNRGNLYLSIVIHRPPPATEDVGIHVYHYIIGAICGQKKRTKLGDRGGEECGEGKVEVDGNASSEPDRDRITISYPV
jgi:hypothetical protein